MHECTKTQNSIKHSNLKHINYYKPIKMLSQIPSKYRKNYIQQTHCFIFQRCCAANVNNYNVIHCVYTFPNLVYNTFSKKFSIETFLWVMSIRAKLYRTGQNKSINYYIKNKKIKIQIKKIIQVIIQFTQPQRNMLFCKQ